MKTGKLFIVLLFLVNSSFAQSNDVSISHTKMSSSVYLSYTSSIIYPGLITGIQVPIRKIHVEKTRKKRDQRRYVKTRFLTANLGWYHHQDFHDNIYLTTGNNWRRTKHNGLFTEFSPKIGYSRTLLGGTTYQVNENGSVSTKKGAGYNYAVISIGGGVGYDFTITQSKPISVYYKLNLLTMFLYNSTFYVRPAMELGVIYTFSNFLKFNSKIKHISKIRS